MTDRQYKKFFREHEGELNDLANILKEADSISNTRYAEYPVEARKLAIVLVERWFTEAFNTENEQPIPYASDGENIFRRLKAESDEGDR